MDEDILLVRRRFVRKNSQISAARSTSEVVWDGDKRTVAAEMEKAAEESTDRVENPY